jgi:TetR/AcrR family transcriptional regulator, fatty acid biosynthesis regulator
MNRLQQKQQTRRKLIDTALAMSAERGFSALSLREIAKNAGISPTGFYRHFRDLDELGLVLVDEVAIALRRLIRDARSRSTDRSRVRASIETFMEYVRESPHHFRLLLGERLGGSAAFRQALRAEIDHFVAELSDDLEAQAKEAGRSSEQVPLAAEAIVAVVFTIGAEALDLPRHRHEGLTDRIIGEVGLILLGAGFTTRAAKERPSSSSRD